MLSHNQQRNTCHEKDKPYSASCLNYEHEFAFVEHKHSRHHPDEEKAVCINHGRGRCDRHEASKHAVGCREGVKTDAAKGVKGAKREGIIAGKKM